jgi:hypothetical protein
MRFSLAAARSRDRSAMSNSASLRRFSLVAAPAIVLSVMWVAVGAEPPPAPAKLATIASADALAAAADEYLKDLAPLVADEAAFTKNKEQAAQKANAIVALAQVLGNHEDDSRWKPAAAQSMTAAAALSRAKDYATAHAAFEQLSAASKSTVAGPAPKWEKAARQGMLMEEIQLLNNSLRRGLRRIARSKESGARDAAVLAAFAQATIYDTHEVKNEADHPKWYELATEFRAAAAELSARYAAADEAGAKAAIDRVEKSCAACHEKFHHE